MNIYNRFKGNCIPVSLSSPVKTQIDPNRVIHKEEYYVQK